MGMDTTLSLPSIICLNGWDTETDVKKARNNRINTGNKYFFSVIAVSKNKKSYKSKISLKIRNCKLS
jgi:hypothetical protein